MKRDMTQKKIERDKTHSFHLEDVEKYGSVFKALIMKELYGMSAYKLRNRGDPWVYYSASALCLKFPYMARSSIDRFMRELEREGHLKSDSTRNVHKYDKTKWYCPMLIDQNEQHCDQNKQHCDQSEQHCDQSEQPIPSHSYSSTPSSLAISEKATAPRGASRRDAIPKKVSKSVAVKKGMPGVSHEDIIVALASVEPIFPSEFKNKDKKPYQINATRTAVASTIAAHGLEVVIKTALEYAQPAMRANKFFKHRPVNTYAFFKNFDAIRDNIASLSPGTNLTEGLKPDPSRRKAPVILVSTNK
jgi:hypothetical protein